MDLISPIIPPITIFLTFLAFYYFIKTNNKRLNLIISFILINIFYISFNKIFLHLKVIEYYNYFIVLNIFSVFFYLLTKKKIISQDVNFLFKILRKYKKSYLLYFFLGVFFYIFVQSLVVPPTNFDSLAYNITRNYFFIQENNIYPNNNFNYYNGLIQPLNSDLLYLKFAYFRTDYFMNIYNLMCYMILGLTFFELFKNLNVKENRILYIILFLSISNLFLSLFNTKNDLYSATFLIINIYLFFIIFDGNKKIIPIFLITIFYTTGIKWTVIFYLLPLFFVTIYYSFKKNLTIKFFKWFLVLSPLALILLPLDTFYFNQKFTGSLTGAVQVDGANHFLHQEGVKGMLANFIRYLIMSIDISIPLHRVGLENFVSFFDKIEDVIQLAILGNNDFGISSIFKNEIKFDYSYVLRPHSDFAFYGILGLIFFITPFLLWKFKKEKQFIIAFISFTFLFLFCFNISWFPWNARYLLPFILLGSILFASLNLRLNNIIRKILLTYSVLLVSFNLLVHVPQPLIKHSKTDSWLTIFKDRENFKKFVIPDLFLVKNLKNFINDNENFIVVMDRNEKLIRLEGHYQSVYALLKEFNNNYIKFVDTNFESLNQPKQIKVKLTNDELNNYLYVINLSNKFLDINNFEIISEDSKNYKIYKRL